MSKEMIATFSDDAYAALKSGEAVDNNGFRSRRGNYYPDQPTYREKDQYQEQMKQAGVDLLIGATGYFTFQIVLPALKKFNDEKIYPFLSSKWDVWRAKKDKEAEKLGMAVKPTENNKNAEASETSEKAKIINLEEYRKRA